MAKKFTKEQLIKIAEEIRNKVNEHETTMSSLLSSYTEMAELFLARPGTQPANTYSNPRLAEMFRAVNTYSKMEYRMLTSQKPFFDLVPMSKTAYENPKDIAAMSLYVEGQLAYSNYSRGLLRALYSKNLFGTTFIEEPYVNKVVNFIGRRAGVTEFKPRSLLQTAFAKNSYDIEESEWVSFADYFSKSKLAKEFKENKDNDAYYLSPELNDELERGIPAMENEWIQQRLQAAGYASNQKDINAREVTSYYGTLDCIDDNTEYYVCVLNRTHTFKISETMGLRPVRVATHLDFELEPLGYGLGSILGQSHREMDSNRRKMIDLSAFAAYNMLVTKRGAFEDALLNIEPLGIIESDYPESIQQLGPNPNGITATANLEMIMKQDFRTAAGTPDILQAMPSGETATEVALTSNAAVRNISVTSEMSSVPLVKKHIQGVIENGQKYMSEPMTVSLGRLPVKIVPSQLLHDVDVVVRTNTDTNFRPARLKNLMAASQLIAASPAPVGMKIDPQTAAAIQLEILRLLDVPATDIYVPLTDNDMAQMALMQQLQAGPQAQGEQPPAPELPPSGGGTELASTPGGTAILPEGDAVQAAAMDEASNP